MVPKLPNAFGAHDPEAVSSSSLSGGSLSTIVAAPRAPSERSRGVLSVMSGRDAGRVMSLPAGVVTTLGRADDCTFRFEDISLSRVHARVMRAGPGHVFHDPGSTNGSFVNGVRVAIPTELNDGDRLQLGTSTNLRFSLVTEEEERALVKVYEASMRDGLTGAFNRKHFDDRLEAEHAFALRHGAPLSVVMMDVDHFKRVNDTYGHLAGDAVLKHLAAILAKGIRTEDVIARYGGEEFALIARGIDAATAVMVANRLRISLAQSTVPFGAHQIQVTLSAGVASLVCCDENADKNALVGLADARLYKAKESGRNRVVGLEVR